MRSKFTKVAVTNSSPQKENFAPRKVLYKPTGNERKQYKKTVPLTSATTNQQVASNKSSKGSFVLEKDSIIEANEVSFAKGTGIDKFGATKPAAFIGNFNHQLQLIDWRKLSAAQQNSLESKIKQSVINSLTNGNADEVLGNLVQVQDYQQFIESILERDPIPAENISMKEKKKKTGNGKKVRWNAQINPENSEEAGFNYSNLSTTRNIDDESVLFLDSSPRELPLSFSEKKTNTKRRQLAKKAFENFSAPCGLEPPSSKAKYVFEGDKIEITPNTEIKVTNEDNSYPITYDQGTGNYKITGNVENPQDVLKDSREDLVKYREDKLPAILNGQEEQVFKWRGEEIEIEQPSYENREDELADAENFNKKIVAYLEMQRAGKDIASYIGDMALRHKIIVKEQQESHSNSLIDGDVDLAGDYQLTQNIKAIIQDPRISFEVTNQENQFTYHLEEDRLVNSLNGEMADEETYRIIIDAALVAKEREASYLEELKVYLVKETYKNLNVLLEASSSPDVTNKYKKRDSDKIDVMDGQNLRYTIYSDGYVEIPEGAEIISPHINALIDSRKSITEEMLVKLAGLDEVVDFVEFVTNIVKNYDNNYEVKIQGKSDIIIDGVTGEIKTAADNNDLDRKNLAYIYNICDLCYNLKRSAEIAKTLNGIKAQLQSANGDPLTVDDISYSLTGDDKLLLTYDNGSKYFINLNNKVSLENGSGLSAKQLRDFVCSHDQEKTQKVVDDSALIADSHASIRKNDVTNIRANIDHVGGLNDFPMNVGQNNSVTATKNVDDVITFQIAGINYTLALDGEAINGVDGNPASLQIHSQIKQAFEHKKNEFDRKQESVRLEIGKRTYNKLKFLIDSQAENIAEIADPLSVVKFGDNDVIEIFTESEGNLKKTVEIYKDGTIKAKALANDVFEKVSQNEACLQQDELSDDLIKKDVISKISTIFTADQTVKFGNISLRRSGSGSEGGLKYEISSTSNGVKFFDIDNPFPAAENEKEAEQIRNDIRSIYTYCYAFYYQTEAAKACEELQQAIGDKANQNFSRYTIEDHAQGIVISSSSKRNNLVVKNGALTKKGGVLSTQEIKDFVAAHNNPEKIRNITLGFEVNEVANQLKSFHEVGNECLNGAALSDELGNTYEIGNDIININKTDIAGYNVAFKIQNGLIEIVDNTPLNTGEKEALLKAVIRQYDNIKNQRLASYIAATIARLGSKPELFIDDNWHKVEKQIEIRVSDSDPNTVMIKNGTSYYLMKSGEAIIGCDQDGQKNRKIKAESLLGVTSKICDPINKAFDEAVAMESAIEKIKGRLYTKKDSANQDEEYRIDTGIVERLTNINPSLLAEKFTVVDDATRVAKLELKGASKATILINKSKKDVKSKEPSSLVTGDKNAVLDALTSIERESGIEEVRKIREMTEVIAYIKQHKDEFALPENGKKLEILNKIASSEPKALVKKFDIVSVASAKKLKKGTTVDLKLFDICVKGKPNAKIRFTTNPVLMGEGAKTYESKISRVLEIEEALKSPAQLSDEAQRKASAVYYAFIDFIEWNEGDYKYEDGRKITLYANGFIKFDTLDSSNKSVSYFLYKDGRIIQKNGVDVVGIDERASLLKELETLNLLSDGVLSESNDGSEQDDEVSFIDSDDSASSEDLPLIPKLITIKPLGILESIKKIQETVPKNVRSGWYHEFEEKQNKNRYKRLFELQRDGGYAVYNIPVDAKNGKEIYGEESKLLNFINEKGNLYDYKDDDQGRLVEPNTREYEKFLTYCRVYLNQEEKRLECGREIYKNLNRFAENFNNNNFRLRNTRKFRNNICDVTYNPDEKEFTIVNHDKEVIIVNSAGTIFTVDEQYNKVEGTFYEGYKTTSNLLDPSSNKVMPASEIVDRGQPSHNRKFGFSSDNYDYHTSVDDEVNTKKGFYTDGEGVSKADIELKIKPSNSIRATAIQKITAVTILVNRSHLSVRGQKFKVLEGIYQTEGDRTVAAKTLDPFFANILTVVADELNLKQTDVEKIVAYARKNGGVSHKLTREGYKDQTSEEIYNDLKIDGETVKAFSRRYQETCKECGIYSGKETSAEGSRLTYISDGVMNSYKTIGKSPNVASKSVQNIKKDVIKELGGAQVIGGR